MAERQMVVIGRHWHSPEILVKVSTDGIFLELSLADFCRALVAEIPHPVKTFTRAGLESNLLAALDVVVGKVKEASVHLPPAAPTLDPGSF